MTAISAGSMETIMGKQMTLAEARARCHALGITPGRSIVECMHRVARQEASLQRLADGLGEDGETSFVVHAAGKTYVSAARMRRVRRAEAIMGSLTGLLTIVRMVPLIKAH
jgi:hypothetical protein